MPRSNAGDDHAQAVHHLPVRLRRRGKPIKGAYAYDGRETLTYKKGNRGVRLISKKTDADAPQFIQFSDHGIAPAKADHYHFYWGNDREALLEEVTSWPTYYPSSLNAKQIVSEMLAHCIHERSYRNPRSTGLGVPKG